jgi:ribose 5-phosphate isomerase B
MKIAVASDHRGFDAKKRLVVPVLQKAGHQVIDFGCNAPELCDYPDFGVPAARAVARGECEIGVLLDGTGIGMSIVANKVAGVRAALAHDDVTARVSREKNHCNVLCVPADLISEVQLRDIVEIFMTTPFTDGRHQNRLEKIRALEEGKW